MTSEKQPLSMEDAMTLLHLLSTDDAFRTAFQASPASALRQFSPQAAASALNCSVPGPLASPAALASVHEELLGVLTGKAIFSHPFCFVEGAEHGADAYHLGEASMANSLRSTSTSAINN